VWLHAHIRSGE